MRGRVAAAARVAGGGSGYLATPPATRALPLRVRGGFPHARIRVERTPYYHLATLPQLLEGTAPGPFQFRALFVWAISAIQSHGWFVSTTDGLRELCYLFDFASTYVLFVLTWLYLGLFIRSNRVKAIGLLLLMFVLCMTFLVPTLFNFYYVSDLPAVCFFTLGLYLLQRGKMLPFYALYAVASLNRETFAFLTVVYVLVNWQKPKRQLVVSCAVQVLIAVTARVFLVSIYGSRTLHHVTLGGNLSALFDPYTICQVLTALGFLWVFPLIGWRLIPDTFLKRACLVLPLVGVASLCMANVDEIRVYGEFTPIVLPPALLVLQRIFADAGPQMTTVR
jgi:hypothetical protein